MWQTTSQVIDGPPEIDLPSGHPKTIAATEPCPGTEPYAPCPCHSGKKYKVLLPGQGTLSPA